MELVLSLLAQRAQDATGLTRDRDNRRE
jgi:hypothetical protein